jgi:hypothetical protein
MVLIAQRHLLSIMCSLRFQYRTTLELATVRIRVHLLGLVRLVLVRFVLSLNLSPIC